MQAVHNAAAACYDDMARKHATDMASKETPFRHFNNFVKKLLIQSALDHARLRMRRNVVVVLDLASGRGGDLFKWQFSQSPKLSKATMSLPSNEVTRATEYHCFDISAGSIESARERSATRSAADVKKMMCTFSVANCFEESFLDGDAQLQKDDADAQQQEREAAATTSACAPLSLRHHERFGQFDIVSVQFAFHYSCVSEESAHRALRAIYDALAPGGVLIATVVDSNTILNRLQRASEPGIVAGRNFQLTFASECIAEQPTFGAPYHFFLDGFVDCDEFFVDIGVLRRLAESIGFEPDTGKPFEQLIPAYQQEAKSLMLTEADRELVSIYRTVVLVKSTTR